MKKFLVIAVCCLCILCNAKAQVITMKSDKDFQPGTWLCFRNTVTVDNEIKDLSLSIAADTKYWLWVNGELHVREGGLKRGPNPYDSYCDVIKSLPAMKQGKNTIAVLVWYFGKNGFSHRNSGTPGITFSLNVNGKQVSEDRKWKVCENSAFYVPEGEKPNFRLAESNIGYDSNEEVGFYSPDYDDSDWKSARVISLEKAGWNKLVDRPIPFWKDYGLKDYSMVKKINDTIYHAYLPYNAQITPFMKLVSEKGKKIHIQTDNYMGGSQPNVYAEYITKKGEQEFECYGWMNGHYVIYNIPSDVEVKELKYRETGYDTSFAGSFLCDDQALNTLWDKAQRTLYITMRDTYMDCPDRERAQWWGDVVNELGEAFYALDEKAHLLTRKGIMELMDWQRADSTIFAPVPAGNYDSELPMQMLASVSYYGFWSYYMGTGDCVTIQYVFPKVKKYIHVWKTKSDGLVIPRKGGWTWGDWGDNKDMELLFNQWYLIALQGYVKMANLVGDYDEADWAETTALTLKKAFHEKYWNGSYYISPNYKGVPDDRSQALAVVSGTLPKELYPVIRPFFEKYYHASPYMEKYVLQALCMMNYHQDAINRIKFRYSEMIHSPLTTLWEGWGIGSKGFGGGTYNHAWSGGPLTIMSQYIAGIETVTPAFETFRVKPNPASLNFIKTVVPLSNDREIIFSLHKDNVSCKIRLEVPYGTKALFSMPYEYERIVINGRIFSGESDEIKLDAGLYNIELTNRQPQSN